MALNLGEVYSIIKLEVFWPHRVEATLLLVVEIFWRLQLKIPILV
jgi:hypothetical protein